jgi:hypothetical protein
MHRQLQIGARLFCKRLMLEVINSMENPNSQTITVTVEEVSSDEKI